MSEDRSGRDEALARRRAHLAVWLREWTLELRLSAATQAPDVAVAEGVSLLPGWASQQTRAVRVGAPRPDDVVLLPPFNAATRQRPVYIAVLEPLTPGIWLVLPFSRFRNPALPGEVRTARTAAALHVICVWNRSAVPQERLCAGWPVGRLNRRERGWIETLMAWEEAGSPLPAALAARVGPPLIHPLDPRHDYVEEERGLWLPDERVAEQPASYRPRLDAPLPLAAERLKRPYRTGGGGKPKP